MSAQGGTKRDLLDTIRRLQAEVLRVTDLHTEKFTKILQAVDAEPEYPGEMSLKMKEALSNADIETITEAMRITVRLTKRGIRQRIEAIVDNAIK